MLDASNSRSSALPPTLSRFFSPLPLEFLARLRSLVPLADKQAPNEASVAMPDVCLPADFEKHCPGRLSALALKARVLMADASSSSSAVIIVPKGTTPAIEEGGVVQTEGEAEPDGGDSSAHHKKRHRGEVDAVEERTPEFLGDGVLGTAAAIAVFGWQSAPGDGKHRLKCSLCNRRLATDNFLTIEADPSAEGSSALSPRGVGGGGGGEGSGRSTKRRRLSGGGTPLKAMDLAAEHRSFCPWAVVHPPIHGESAGTGCTTVSVMGDIGSFEGENA